MKEGSKSSVFRFARPSPLPQLKYVGFLLIFVGIVQGFTTSFSFAVLPIIIGLFVLTLQNWIHLDIGKLQLTFYIAFIPYRRKKLGAIQQIRLKCTEVHQTLHSRGSTSTVNFTQYSIMLDDGSESVALQEGKCRSKLQKKAVSLAQAAGVKLLDTTKKD
jgi:uncharacterized protein (DUF58 family)